MTSLEMEIAITKKFGVRKHIMVPNVSWGLDLHECDLVVMSKAGYLTEVEIKISRADLKKDIEKKHGHYSDKIKYLYFAIPKKLEKDIEFIPERAGIIILHKYEGSKGKEYISSKIFRKATMNKGCRKLSESEQKQLMRLGVMRIWKLKQNILKLKNKES